MPLSLAVATARKEQKKTGLALWMDRVLDLASKIEPHWDADDIHDLRVAIRRSSLLSRCLPLETETSPEAAGKELDQRRAGSKSSKRPASRAIAL